MNQNLWNYKPKINHSFFKLLWFLSLFSFIYILCVWVFVCMSVCEPHAFSVWEDKKRASDSPGLEPWMLTVVNIQVGAGGWTLLLWKSSQCSHPPSHLSSSCWAVLGGICHRERKSNWQDHWNYFPPSNAEVDCVLPETQIWAVLRDATLQWPLKDRSKSVKGWMYVGRVLTS